MRTHHRTNCVVGMFNSRHPVAHRFVHRIFQCAATRLSWNYFCAKQTHSENVQSLALNVYFTHVHLATKAKQGCCSCRCNTVLPSACLGNNALLAHPLRQKRLTEHAIDLVRTGVVQIFTLQDQANSKFATKVVALCQD